VGEHVVEFRDIPPEESSGCFGPRKRNWTTPDSVTVNIEANQMSAVTGVYVLSEKALAASTPGNGSGGDLTLIAFVGGALLAAQRGKHTLARGP
jgi:hypothetical protein